MLETTKAICPLTYWRKANQARTKPYDERSEFLIYRGAKKIWGSCPSLRARPMIGIHPKALNEDGRVLLFEQIILGNNSGSNYLQ